MPAHLVTLALLPFAWRLLAELRHWEPLPKPLLILATAIIVVIMLTTYGGLMGRRAAVSLLVLMLALKLLETFRTRDARIVASLSLFLCGTQFLFSQGVAMIVYLAACVLSSLIALVYLHRREAYEGLRAEPDTDHNLFTELGFGVRMMAIALPIGLVFFLLFPRWGSPLWGLPEDALDARSGLSGSMSPGSIQNLFMDDSPAFRVQFESTIPEQNKLYWRGPVFWSFDGRSWQAGQRLRDQPVTGKPDPESASLRYKVQMEPTEQHWLFALDYPALVPSGTRLSMDYQLLSKRPITRLHEYVMASDPDFPDNPTLKRLVREAALELPTGFNPRTAELMAQWRDEATYSTEIVRRALAYFNREQFYYTLNPSLLSRHTVDEFLFETREGFCEHYASAFTVMMRMAGIPARVVTGYQGGWYNDIGSYLLVRQSDAHAWSEVWIENSGWMRIDPTAAVAPERVEQGAMDSLSQRRYILDFEWIRQARNSFDVFQRVWNNWVVAFNSDRQSRLFSVFGWGVFDSARLVIVMMTIIVLLSVAIFVAAPLLLKFRSAQRQDTALKLWRKFSRKLAKAGFVSHPSMGPLELATNANCQLKYEGDDINRVARLYMLCRYSRGAGNEADLAKLINDLRL